MSSYTAPLKDLRFVRNELAGLSEIAKLPGSLRARHGGCGLRKPGSPWSARSLNHTGDQEGAVWSDGNVRTPKGFKEAYKLFCEGG